MFQKYTFLSEIKTKLLIRQLYAEEDKRKPVICANAQSLE